MMKTNDNPKVLRCDKDRRSNYHKPMTIFSIIGFSYYKIAIILFTKVSGQCFIDNKKFVVMDCKEHRNKYFMIAILILHGKSFSGSNYIEVSLTC